MDDGFAFYVSNNETLSNKSQPVLDTIDYIKNQGYVELLNDYKYNFVVNANVSGTTVKNATLFLNINNASWTGYFADQTNSTPIQANQNYTFTKQFNTNDNQTYWKAEICAANGVCENTSESSLIQIITSTVSVSPSAPASGQEYRKKTLDFKWTPTDDIEMTNCKLYINGTVEATDVNPESGVEFSVSKDFA